MHRALWLLLWLDLKSSVRGVFRGRQSWRKIGLLVMLILFVVMIAGSQYASVVLSQNDDSIGTLNMQKMRFGAAMPFWTLIYLLATWLMGSADRGLVMRPAEIQFLVAGPFTTREILTLNLVRLAYRAFISSLILATVAWAYMPNFFAGMVGIWMVLAVSLLVGMAASLAARHALPAFVRGGRVVLSIVAVAVLVTIVSQSVKRLTSLEERLDFSKIAAMAPETPMGSYVLPPFRWMFAPLQQTEFWPLVPWQVIERTPVFMLLVLLVFALGGAFGEAATERTDRALARRQAALRSGITNHSTLGRRLSIPQFGRWAGVGSVAWMEMMQALRLLPRFMLYTASIVTIILIVPLMISGERMDGVAGLNWLAGLTSYADFLMLLQFPVAFLGPVSHRLILKSLPLPAWRVVLGALAGPMFPLMVTHLLITTLFVFKLRDQLGNVLLVSLALIPAAFVLTATVNLLGLWNIIKPRALQQRDALAAGRAMLSVWLFTFMLVPPTVLTILGALAVSSVAGHSLTTYVLGGMAGLLLSSWALVGLLAYFFERWYPASGSVEEEQEFDR